MPANLEFANYCCDLLASVGRCVPKRMFGGFGISTDGLTIATLWPALERYGFYSCSRVYLLGGFNDELRHA